MHAGVPLTLQGMADAPGFVTRQWARWGLSVCPGAYHLWWCEGTEFLGREHDLVARFLDAQEQLSGQVGYFTDGALAYFDVLADAEREHHEGHD